MSGPDVKLSELGERVAAAERFSVIPAVVMGIGLVGVAWGWRAAVGAGGVYLLALAWKWVAG